MANIKIQDALNKIAEALKLLGADKQAKKIKNISDEFVANTFTWVPKDLNKTGYNLPDKINLNEKHIKELNDKFGAATYTGLSVENNKLIYSSDDKSMELGFGLDEAKKPYLLMKDDKGENKFYIDQILNAVDAPKKIPTGVFKIVKSLTDEADVNLQELFKNDDYPHKMLGFAFWTNVIKPSLDAIKKGQAHGLPSGITWENDKFTIDSITNGKIIFDVGTGNQSGTITIQHKDGTKGVLNIDKLSNLKILTQADHDHIAKLGQALQDIENLKNVRTIANQSIAMAQANGTRLNKVEEAVKDIDPDYYEVGLTLGGYLIWKDGNTWRKSEYKIATTGENKKKIGAYNRQNKNFIPIKIKRYALIHTTYIGSNFEKPIPNGYIHLDQLTFMDIHHIEKDREFEIPLLAYQITHILTREVEWRSFGNLLALWDKTKKVGYLQYENNDITIPDRHIDNIFAIHKIKKSDIINLKEVENV